MFNGLEFEKKIIKELQETIEEFVGGVLLGAG